MAAHFSYTLTVQLEYTNHLLQFFKLFSYYAGIMLNAFSDLLFSKLCWYNRLVPTANPNRAYPVQPTANPNRAYPVQPTANPNRAYPVQPTVNPNQAFQVQSKSIMTG